MKLRVALAALLVSAPLAILAIPALAHERGMGMMMGAGDAGGMGMMGGSMMDMMMGQGSGMGMGGSMMGGSTMDPDMVGMGLGRMLQLPDLSDEQRQTLTNRHRELQRQLLRLQEKALDARFAAQDAWADETPEPEAVGRALQGVFDVHRQMVEAAIAARNDMRNVLTDEQREALETRGRGMMGMPMRGTMMQRQ